MTLIDLVSKFNFYAMNVSNIFIIDDDPFFAKTFEKKLREMSNFNIYLFESCEQALQVLLNIKPEIIFLDHLLGGLNGIDALPIFKSKLPKTQVCMVSNQLDINLCDTALKEGASNYFSKDALLISNTQRFIEKVEIKTRGIQDFWKKFILDNSGI